MFKLLGHALAHSFGLVIIILANVFSVVFNGNGQAVMWMDIIYTGGYAMIPVMHLFNVLAEGRTKRRTIKINMNSNEYLKEFNYTMGKKYQKKLDKMNFKKTKKELVEPTQVVVAQPVAQQAEVVNESNKL